VKLVRVAGQEGEQVYIQIGNAEMEMLTQQQAEQVSLMLCGLASGNKIPVEIFQHFRSRFFRRFSIALKLIFLVSPLHAMALTIGLCVVWRVSCRSVLIVFLLLTSQYWFSKTVCT